MFDKEWFCALDIRLREMGLDSDAQSFDEIKEMLSVKRRFNPDEFADMCAYVVLAGGFSQKTAKKIHSKIMNFIRTNGADFDALIAMFNNKNKINAICKLWHNRAIYCDEYYACLDTDAKIKYLQNLPHIGQITANHLARNLGEDVVKYDIWIQRLGCVFANNPTLSQKINNATLDPDIKSACDAMFAHMVRETGLPRGYIDVVLWKALQNKLISVDNC